MPSRRILIRPFQLLTFRGRHLPDMSWITPTLSISGTLKPKHVTHLANMGIGAIVDMRSEAKDDEKLLLQYGIHFLHLVVRDHKAPSEAQLIQGTKWVLTQLATRKRVLIHCREGVGRSAVLACCVLMCQGKSLESAMALLKSKRWGIHPRKHQRESLQQFAYTTVWRNHPLR
jgi:protein tyrosine phosphatase (PTP) superfamily phosphohydrolase (DUF442 family)